MLSLLKVPKLSAPLTKAIRTSEGVMVWALNLSIAALTLVDPSRLPAKEAAILVSATTALHTAQRFGLKAIAMQKEIGIGPPTTFDPVPAAAAGEIEQIVADGAQLAGTLASRPASALTPDGAKPAAPSPAGTRSPAEVAAIAAQGAPPGAGAAPPAGESFSSGG
jgi:hypothetical protein